MKGIRFRDDGSHVSFEAEHPTCSVRARGKTGWLARVTIDPDPDAERDTKLTFRPWPPDVNGSRTFYRLEDGVWVCGTYNDADDRYRVWFAVKGGEIETVTTDYEEGRGLLGLRPWKDALYERALEENASNALPPLRGTHAQVTWAESLRAKVVRSCPSELLWALRARDSAVLTAGFWISCRSMDPLYTLTMLIGDWYGVEPDKAAESFGRALASRAYEHVEPDGEVSSKLVSDINNAVDGFWPSMRYCKPLLDDEGARLAYRARWSELLARGTVFVADG